MSENYAKNQDKNFHVKACVQFMLQNRTREGASSFGNMYRSIYGSVAHVEETLLGNGLEAMWEFIYNLLLVKCVSVGHTCNQVIEGLVENDSLHKTCKLLEFDIMQLHKTISNLTYTLSTFKSDEKSLMLKLKLLNVNSLLLQEYFTIIDAYVHQLRNRNIYCQKSAIKPKDLSEYVKSTCSHVVDLLEDVNEKKGKFEVIKVNLLTEVEILWQSSYLEEIVGQLTALTESAIYNINKMIESSNSVNEVTSLRYSFVNGRMEDISADSSVSQSVDDHNMVAGLTFSCLCRALFQSKQEVNEANCKLYNLQQNCDIFLNAESSEHKLINHYIQSELEYFGCLSMNNVLTVTSHEFLETQLKNDTHIKELETKKCLFGDNNIELKLKDAEVQKTVEHSSLAKSMLSNKKFKIQMYIISNITPYRPDMSLIIEYLNNFSFKEIQLLPCIKFHGQELRHYYELSHFDGVSIGFPCLSFIWFCFLTSKENSCVTAIVESSDEGVMNSSKLSHQSQSVMLLRLDCDLSMISKAIVNVSMAQQSLSEWWMQPAQNFVNWTIFEGMSFTQWLEQWHLLTQKYNELRH